MDLSDLQALLGESPEADDYRDLWVVDLNPLPQSSETWEAGSLLGEARRMADSLGAYVHYVGAAAPAEAIAFGADRVHPLQVESGEAAVAALFGLFSAHKPEFVLFTAADFSDEGAGRLAQRLGGSVVYDCIALRLDESTRELVGSHPVYDGAYYLDTALVAKPALVTVRPGALAAPLRDGSRSGEIETVEIPSVESRMRALGPAKFSVPTVPLHKAARVLAVGRAGNNAESIEVAKQLAATIGAHFAGDRSAFDSGWINREQIVGVVGTEIAPELYLAAGVWGDTLHRVGVEGAKYIIAIHPDKNAPIFRYADVCLVGQPKALLPQLLELLGASQG